MKVNILSIEYIVNNVNEKDRKGDMGEADFLNKAITIYKHDNKQEENKTLLHEIIECMNHEFNIKLKHEQIEKLEDAIYDTWRRNDLKELFE